MNYYMWNPMMRGYGLFGSGIGFLFTLLFWGLIIFLIVALVKRAHGKEEQTDSKGALDILKERYAKGEIDKKQFQEMKKDISD